ncbi:hypothetical protein [Pseudomonas viridiflava]|uniref:hypothetical protein n=1 Tax=Pseudomonas viridiflava TaxID=33069 RepID=UPI000F026CE7|nr:hypothetical protein [Pseudomonas viridiflava]
MKVAEHWKQLLQGSGPDTVEKPQDTPESLIYNACRSFISQCNRTQEGDDLSILQTAENLAEQILKHYGSLRQAAIAFRAHSSPGERLPEPVFNTILYATVREHETLTVMLDELHELCEGKGWREMSSMDSVLLEPRFRLTPRPSLWDDAGVMKYNPAAFNNVHGHSLRQEALAMYQEGASGVSRLLSYYPQMDEQSRRIFDTLLVNQVYYSYLPDDDPVRNLLADKLDPVEDAKARIAGLFNDTLELRNEPGGPFLRRLEACFDFVDTLSPQQATGALEQVTDALVQMLDMSGSDLGNPVEPVACIIKVLHKAAGHGYDVLEALHPTFKYMGDQGELVETMFRSTTFGKKTTNSAKVVMEAVLLAVDEQKLLSLTIDDSVLSHIALARGSDVLRNALLKSSTGRDIIFGQDLGL